MNQLERIIELVRICRTQLIFASRKKQKLRIYEDFLDNIEKVAEEQS